MKILYKYLNLALAGIMFAAPFLVFFGSIKGCSKKVGKIIFFPKDKYVSIETEANIFQKPKKYVIPDYEMRTTCEIKPASSGTELEEFWTVYPKFDDPKYSLFVPVNLKKVFEKSLLDRSRNFFEGV